MDQLATITNPVSDPDKIPAPQTIPPKPIPDKPLTGDIPDLPPPIG